VHERLQLVTHALDTWTLQQAAEEGKGGAASNVLNPSPIIAPVAVVPLAEAVVSSATLQPSVPEHQPLGRKLLTELREVLKPTLTEQLEGVDSPFQPPSVIAKDLDRALRRHMKRVRRTAERDEDQDKTMRLPNEYGHALVELMRELAQRLRATAPKSGDEAYHERAQINSALGSGEQFQNALWRAEAFAGHKVQIWLGHDRTEGLELAVTNTATFKVLIGTAAKYWHIDPSKYAMCDTLGILFVRRMGVLEGLRLCPPGTQLKLIPLYDGHHDDDAPHHEGARAAVDLAALVKHRQQDGARQNVAPPQWANDDDEEDEALPAPTVYKRVWFALGDGRMTRCGMFMGVMQTLIAILMLALLICVRWDHSEAQQVCAAHVNLMVDSQFTSHQGYLTSFRDLSSLGHLGAFFKVHMPNVLYGSAADGVMTPLVGGSSVVVGGFRLEQRRSKVIDAARCTSAPFVTSNEPIPYHHQGFTSMVNSHGFSNLTNADILPTPNAVTAQAITTAYINGPRDVNDCYLPIKSETREGLGNDDTEPFAAGSLSLEELVGTRNVATSLPEVKCHEQCSPPRLPGIAGAFVHQSYEQLGQPYSIIDGAAAEAGAFAITFPANTTRKQYDETIAMLGGDFMWLDAQTRTVDVHLPLYDVDTQLMVVLQLRARISTTGSIASEYHCVGSRLREISGDIALEAVCMLGYLLMSVSLALGLCFQKKLAPGEQPVRCRITADIFYTVVVCIAGFLGLSYRVFYFAKSLELLEFFYEGADWPPPYMPALGLVSEFNIISTDCLGWGLLACTLRFTLYYSIVSKGLYIIRLTVSRALYRLVPSLFFLIATMIAFAITGHLLYNSTLQGFRSPQAALQTVLHLLRKPTFFEFDHARLTAHSPVDEVDVSRLFFVFGYTLTTIWIMSNVYKAVVIGEFSNVILLFRSRPPADLKDDPWPPFSPSVIAKQQNERWQERRHQKYVMKGKQREWRVGVEKQMVLQKQFRERLHQAQQQHAHAAAAPEAAKVPPKEGAAVTTPEKHLADLGRMAKRLRLNRRRAFAKYLPNAVIGR